MRCYCLTLAYFGAVVEERKDNTRFAYYALGALLAGLVGFWLTPLDWLEKEFIGSVAVTLLFGVVANIDTKDVKPVSKPISIISYVLLGTSRPTAEVKHGLTLKLFLLSALYTVGLVTGLAIRIF